MRESRINTMDQALIDYARSHASLQRTTVLEVFTRFVLHLRRVHDDDPTQALLDDPGFRDGLPRTMAKTQSGEARWSSATRSSDERPFQRRLHRRTAEARLSEGRASQRKVDLILESPVGAGEPLKRSFAATAAPH